MEKEARERGKLQENISVCWSEILEDKKTIIQVHKQKDWLGRGHENISLSFGAKWRVTCVPKKGEVLKINEGNFRRVIKFWDSCSSELMVKADLEQEKSADSVKGPLDVKDHGFL